MGQENCKRVICSWRNFPCTVLPSSQIFMIIWPDKWHNTRGFHDYLILSNHWHWYQEVTWGMIHNLCRHYTPWINTEFSPENGWLEYDRFLLGAWPIFRCYCWWKKSQTTTVWMYKTPVWGVIPLDSHRNTRWQYICFIFFRRSHPFNDSLSIVFKVGSGQKNFLDFPQRSYKVGPKSPGYKWSFWHGVPI